VRKSKGHIKLYTLDVRHIGEKNMSETVRKEEVEELLKCKISDKVFSEALQYAKHMQKYIYQQEQRSIVLQDWYLVKLTEEYVRSLNFSKYTMELCKNCEGGGRDPSKREERLCI